MYLLRIEKKRNIKIKKNQWLSNYLEATKIKDIDLIVELIGGAEGPAKKLVFNALKNKKHVVTATKKLIYDSDVIVIKNIGVFKVQLQIQAGLWRN